VSMCGFELKCITWRQWVLCQRSSRAGLVGGYAVDFATLKLVECISIARPLHQVGAMTGWGNCR